jgi:hypothetical protein
MGDHLVPKLGKIVAVSLEYVVKHSLHMVGLWAEWVGEQGLVSSFPIAVNGGFYSKKLIGFYLGYQAIASRRKRLGWDGMNPAPIYPGG